MRDTRRKLHMLYFACSSVFALSAIAYSRLRLRRLLSPCPAFAYTPIEKVHRPCLTSISNHQLARADPSTNATVVPTVSWSFENHAPTKGSRWPPRTVLSNPTSGFKLHIIAVRSFDEDRKNLESVDHCMLWTSSVCFTYFPVCLTNGA
jgi:hypothetical protein